MSIKITLEFATTEAAIVALAAVRASEGKPDPKPTPEAKPETTKADAKPKKAAAETAPTAAPAQTAASPTPPAESPAPTTSSGPSRDEVGAAIKAGAATNREAVVATLAKFGAKAGKDLKDDQLAAFAADLALALKPADDLA